MSASRAFSQASTLWSLLRHSRKTRDQIIAFQNRQLRRLIKHAYTRVPYYRKLFDTSGVRPHDIRSVDDLRHIPITTREEIQSLPAEDLIAEGINPDDLVVHRTAGSSGMPITIRRTMREVRLMFIFYLRAMHDFGLKMKDRGVNVRLHGRPEPTLLYHMRRALELYRWDHVDCLKEPFEILRILQKNQPDVLAGYPGTLFHCADFLLGNRDFTIKPRFIVTGGEVLAPLMRKKIAEAFSAPVFDTYNSRELGHLAWECKATGEYHTCDDGIILEVLKNGRSAKEGERGEVVGTNLHAFTMPFIRYRLGDIVTRGSAVCACGRPFSTIREIQGRMLDYLQLPDGRRVHPYEITHRVAKLRDEFPWIRQYQLVQERLDRIVLKLVTNWTPPPKEVARIEESVRSFLGGDVEFEAIVVPVINPDPSGKFRTCLSLVRSAYGENE